MRIFEIESGRPVTEMEVLEGEGQDVFPTKREAVAYLKKLVASDEWDEGEVHVKIHEIETGKIDRQSLCAIINSRGGRFVQDRIRTYDYVAQHGKVRSV